MGIPEPPLLARVFRGPRVESVHFGYVAVVTASGELIFAAGDPHTGVYLRSAAKPFQAMPLIKEEVHAVYDLSDRELALICASHNGEAHHVEAAASILKKCGLSEDHLRCGTHRPIGVDLGVVAEQPAYSVLQNNCSGKHAGMLAACRFHRWPLDTYLDPGHPHQQRILDTVAAMSSLSREKIGVDIDGCSAPVFYMPLHNLARMYARLAGENPVCSKIYDIMWRHAHMVAGQHRFDTAVMEALKGKLVAKTGAEGVQCFAIRGSEPLGVAIKIADGNSRAVPPVAIKLLTRLGLLGEKELRALQAYVLPERRNHRHILIGRIDSPLDIQ